MSKKVYWGIAALIILVIGTFAFIFIRDWISMRQLEQELIRTIEKWENYKESAKTPIDFTKPPPGKSFENGGHWHNGEWHDSAHEVHEVANDISDINDIPKTDEIADINNNTTSNNEIKVWHIRYNKAHEKWIKTGENLNNYRKGKWTPEHIQSLTNVEKKEIATKLKSLIDEHNNSIKNLDAIYNEMQF